MRSSLLFTMFLPFSRSRTGLGAYVARYTPALFLGSPRV